MIQIFKMAYRALERNRRRSIFSAMAVALALMVLILSSSFLRAEFEDSLALSIRLQSGHIQVRSLDYNENKTSLKWNTLLENPDQLSASIASMEQVRVATPRLYASGFLSIKKKSVGARIFGVDPLSEANAPYRDGLISGEWLTPEDRTGILIGKPSAEKLGLKAGDQISLSVNTSNGDIDEQLFTIRGIYSTDTNSFDNLVIFMPLAKLQAIVRAENHASAIFILLKDINQTDAVVAKLPTNFKILTYTQMNDMMVQVETMAKSYMVFMYLIVLAIAATVIVNTLIMSVFERTREIGIMSAIGMRSGRIMAIFLAETSLIAAGGILIGVVLGVIAVSNFSFYVGNFGMTGVTIGNTIHAKLNFMDVINMSIMTFVTTVLAGLYPSLLAARLEPVQALRAEK